MSKFGDAMQPERLIAVVNYDADFGLIEWACRTLKIRDLKRLHEREDLIGKPIFDAMSTCRRQLAECFVRQEPDFRRLFTETVNPIFGILNGSFQVPPMFRVHLNGCPSVSSPHRDREYGMPVGRLNAWIPLTDAWGNNSIWIESEDHGDLRPLTVRLGQMLIFDSANLLHGSFFNDTGCTRVSIDSRFTPTGDNDHRTPVAFCS